MLRHFSLINYGVPTERLEAIIPREHFEIAKFETGEGPRSFVSVVPFLDLDFNFPRLAPWLKFSFYQTNHRAYVIDRKTGQHAVWFFGTNLGSPLVHLPRLLWKIPWHYTRYCVDCRYSPALKRYESYRYDFESEWCSGRTRLRDTGEPIELMPGFKSLDEMKLILTHPVRGYYRGLDGRIGTYEIWHKEMECTKGIADDLYYSLYERLGLMSKEEMLRPHSIFMCPEIQFDIHLPPTRLGTGSPA